MYKTEFPDFNLDVPIPAGFVDNSWHNNVMPCWVRELHDERMAVLWIDYADPALRDHPQNARFVLQVMDISMTDIDESFASNDYDEVLIRLTDYFPYIYLTDDELRKVIAELWKRIPADDHARNFADWEAVSNMDDEMQARANTSEVF